MNNLVKRILSPFLIPCLLALFIFNLNVVKVKAISPDWVEVESAKNGRQWWDSLSIKEDHQGYISVNTKYLPAEDDNNNKLREIYYTMSIDCSRKRYKDIVIDGIRQEKTYWKESIYDRLTQSIIEESCNKFG
ncbi:hypothetical protein [Prochlorococcus marinus]|uniref:Uncharacterized protein n=1 Tax=Prochlorococcus marinus (strain MIT 9211) TaxID=93059 RepID=A9BAP7_PROM4|nr:hypothetical protein [Prochlorococcus marinus]ABX08909.1 Hypothetical protein P9211_09781 [Prochlorococcus marinus str. MIT 9211]